MNPRERMGIPLRPDYSAVAAEQRRSLHRAFAASALCADGRNEPEKILRSAWPRDEKAALLLRAATSPTETGNFPKVDVVAAFRSLAPASVALSLFARGLQLDLSGLNTIRIPGVTSAPQVSFIEEGEPAPVAMFQIGNAAVLGPVCKLLILSAVSAELNDAVPETAAAVIGHMLGDATNKALDAQVFSAAAATPAAPAGLFHAVSALPPASGSTPMVDDIGALVAGIAAAHISIADVIIVAAPSQATQLQLTAGPKFPHDIVACPALADKTVAAIAVAGIASAIVGAPQLETSIASLMHYENTTPLPIAAGSPGVVASPSLSAFQQNLISLKVRGQVCWTAWPGAVQIITSTAW